MNQIFHIFKKDARRHWPEILISLVLLATYTHRVLHPYLFNPYLFLLRFFYQEQFVTIILLLFWAFLVVRVVHGEVLVGDRQWWVSKPYVWWKLLGAKLLVILVFISLPLIHAQLFLLHEQGFAILPNISGILEGHLALFLLLFFPCLVIGCLTKNLGQALLAVVLISFAIPVISWCIDRAPSGDMSSEAEITGWLILLFIFCAAAGATLWQFARRKTWSSRAMVVSGFAGAAVVGAFTPYQSVIQHRYPPMQTGAAPARFTLLPIEPNPEEDSAGEFPNQFSKIIVSVPVEVSGVAPGTLVRVNGIQILPESPSSTPTATGWTNASHWIWQEGGQLTLNYTMDRNDYNRMKNDKVQLEIALTEYHESEPVEIVVNRAALQLAGFGNCSVWSQATSSISCQRPIHQPAYMATFDPSKANCASGDQGKERGIEETSHAFSLTEGDFPGAPLKPVLEYSMYFQLRPTLQSKSPSPLLPERLQPRLCPGAPIHIAKPVLTRRVRIRLDTHGTPLRDLVGEPWR